MEWVVKIGGSLFPHHAMKLLEALQGENILVICGGGEFANQIRGYDEKLHFSDDAAHETAILCMDIIGRLLADKLDCVEAVYSLNGAKKTLNEDKIPILLPSRLLNYLDPLEHSWKVTSDSLSFHISQIIHAKHLIATNVDGIYTRKPSVKDAKLINEISAKKLLSFGETSIDAALPELLSHFGSNCYVVNGKYPERVLSIIKGRVDVDKIKYTLVKGD
jgi:5-(aminomethyl)-3-furanmethanol phosphate kinase